MRKPKVGFMALCAPVHVELIDDLNRPFPVTGEAELAARALKESGCKVYQLKDTGIIQGEVKGLQVSDFDRECIIDSKEKAFAAVNKFLQKDVDCLVLFFTTWMWMSHYTQALMKANLPMIIWTGNRLEGCQAVGLWGMHGTLDEIGMEHKLIYGMPDDEKTVNKAMSYIRAAMVKNVLRNSKFGQFGSRCMDMIPGLLNDAEWLSKFGIEAEHLDQYLLVIEAERFTNEEVKKTYEEVKKSVGKMPDLDNLTKRAIRLYLAQKKLIKKHQLDFLGVKCVFELSDNYCTPCLSQCMLLEEGIATACCGEPRGALTMYIMRILTDAPMFQGDVEQVLVDKKILRMASCGSAPISLADDFKNVQFVTKPALEGDIGGVSIEISAKPGVITLARISKIKDRYVMHISKGEVFTDDPEAKKGTGFPTLPFAAIKLHGDPEKFIQNVRSQYMHFCYGDITSELLDVCKLLDIDPIVS
ncbi:MAG: hypothetical protein M1371_03490 [Actinobacteria bacterium]|nr:hypothetical protein [Actinomycetota bacterium]